MTQTTIHNSFTGGEISPSLYGRVDLAKWNNGCSTLRNFFVNYRGGASSRAGLAYVGMCKQPGTAAPPRDIPFQYSINIGFALEFGDQYMRVKYRGAYVTEAAIAVTSVSPGGVFTTGVAHGYAVGDWVYNLGNAGFNGLTWIVRTVPSSTTFTVNDLFGNPVTVAAASTGGTVARIYTAVSPYAAVDLPFLKFAQDVNNMALTCVNQDTRTEYPPYELVRQTNTNWTFTPTQFLSSVVPPANLVASAHASTTTTTFYSYVVTAVSAATGEESVASVASTVKNNDISVYAGTNTLTWNPVPGAASYNIYMATPCYATPPAVGCLYGYIGASIGTSFTDTNITIDFTKVPPVHTNPFARTPITNVAITSGGANYTQATVG